MSQREHFPLPPEQEHGLRRAKRLQWIWLAFLISIVAVIYVSLGNSQAMKTAWVEDLLSFVPPLAFLISTHIERWPPNDRFPIGHIRVTSITYLVSAVALAGVGLFLIYDASSALIRTEHPTIGSVELFGVTFWFGWLMIAALIYSVIPPVIFGRLKMGPARDLHDKVLWADALMNKADWMTGLAAVVGILGIGFGWWWADAVAAIVIALDVLHDGYHHTMAAIRDLVDEVPRTVDDQEIDPLANRVSAYVDDLAWVKDSKARLREEGRFLTGAVYVQPHQSRIDAAWISDAEAKLRQLHWRVDHIAVVPVEDLGPIQGGRTR